MPKVYSFQTNKRHVFHCSMVMWALAFTRVFSRWTYLYITVFHTRPVPCADYHA